MRYKGGSTQVVQQWKVRQKQQATESQPVLLQFKGRELGKLVSEGCDWNSVFFPALLGILHMMGKIT